MNHIIEYRKRISQEFATLDFKRIDSERSHSPSGNFCVDITQYVFSSTHKNLHYSTVVISELKTEVAMFSFLVNDHCFYEWLEKDSKEFLVCAEDVSGGQTMINLTNKIMESYSPAENGFIWTDFKLSPDGNTLAVLGCYWARPTVLKLFNFSEPLLLPLKELNEIELLGNDEIIVGWIDNKTIKMKGVKREQVAEYSEGGGFRMKTLSETPIEREINIDVI